MSFEAIRALRRNHALEHATITLLIGRLGLNIKVVGQSTPAGFYIYGDIPTQAVREAATDALARLQKGEAELAISPFCGTNLAVAAVLMGISTLWAVGRKNRLRQLPQAILVALASLFLAQPVGRLVQRHLTTSPSLGQLRIARIICQRRGRRTLHKVETV